MPRSVEDFFRHMRTKLVQSQVWRWTVCDL
jgi:hypothetical protein